MFAPWLVVASDASTELSATGASVAACAADGASSSMAATTATRRAWGVLEGTAGSGAPIEEEEGFSRRYSCAERRVKAEFRARRSVAGARPYVAERVARDR